MSDAFVIGVLGSLGPNLSKIKSLRFNGLFIGSSDSNWMNDTRWEGDRLTLEGIESLSSFPDYEHLPFNSAETSMFLLINARIPF